MIRTLMQLTAALALLGISRLHAAPATDAPNDPNGFSVNLPQGWAVQKYQQGYVRIDSPDNRRFVLVRPILGRTSDCAESLRRAFGASWAAFPGTRNLEVGYVPGSRGLATARFTFQDGRSRGAVMCAETSSSTGMYYGLAAPVESFAQELPNLVAILKSFRYGGSGGRTPGAAQGSTPPSLPRMTSWREPQELAYTLQVPEGWRTVGGLTRLDVTHARSGVEVTSPDGQAMLRFGDPRLPACTVPGPGAYSMPSAGGLNYCPYQTGSQAGAAYLSRTLAREWGVEGLVITNNSPRQDLSAAADRGPAQFGLNVRNSFAEIHFRGTRRGSPVEGLLLANTPMMGAAAGQNFIVGAYTTEFAALMGPPARVAELTAIAGHMVATTRWSVEWWQREQRIGMDVARRTLAMLQSQGENQQQAFWARMDASDRRRDAVNDILGGSVRLSDGEGRVYDAKAGSNYYFLDTDAARRAGRPSDAVVGADVYPSPIVDLRPLEVIR
jgi:hypothetical protein